MFGEKLVSFLGHFPIRCAGERLGVRKLLTATVCHHRMYLKMKTCNGSPFSEEFISGITE